MSQPPLLPTRSTTKQEYFLFAILHVRVAHIHVAQMLENVKSKPHFSQLAGFKRERVFVGRERGWWYEMGTAGGTTRGGLDEGAEGLGWVGSCCGIRGWRVMVGGVERGIINRFCWGWGWWACECAGGEMEMEMVRYHFMGFASGLAGLEHDYEW
ncbi:hypothetical protein EJ04DRAFT_61045 [Polyplosphaeria fusca]|uniref:Uncharacterized protein n=1 Tax=Polyplosphaeria fusca TaxID=682080 RepID=A0A9P4R3X1_9PLEO|nr:hypothetical protein EJ04DRAFT_61045 [Polyplosphaeria fusca]